MNDDVKAEIDLWRREMADGDPEWWVREQLILAHIDGEPARIAAAREEQRASDAEQLARIWYGLPNAGRADHGPVAVVRSTPLTATPLADALRLANETVVKLAQAAANTAGADASAAALRAMARATKAEAERDEAQRGEQEAWRQTDQMRAERDALRAQVEAARTYARQALDYGEDCDATDLLAAMDEAKP